MGFGSGVLQGVCAFGEPYFHNGLSTDAHAGGFAVECDNKPFGELNAHGAKFLAVGSVRGIHVNVLEDVFFAVVEELVEFGVSFGTRMLLLPWFVSV